jgi:hypothetical protein
MVYCFDHINAAGILVLGQGLYERLLVHNRNIKIMILVIARE